MKQLWNTISASEYEQSVTGDGRIYPVIYSLARITSFHNVHVTAVRILNVALPGGISFIVNRLTHIWRMFWIKLPGPVLAVSATILRLNYNRISQFVPIHLQSCDHLYFDPVSQ
jgi:hypothetical protein